MNKKGSILAITIAFVVVFIILGVSAIYLSTLQSDIQARDIQSQRAFWIAEAGIAKAIVRLPETTPSPLLEYLEENADESYSIMITPTAGFTNRWTIQSTGFVPNATRTIEVEIEGVVNNITGVINANGDVDIDGSSNVTGTVNENLDPPLAFESVFLMTKDQVRHIANNHYINPAINQTPVTQITWVTGDLAITTTGWQGYGLLVVDGNLRFAGGSFSGIIWVTGDLDCTGNPDINGSIFVEGETTIKVTGNGEISEDAGAVDDAWKFLSSAFRTVSGSWREVYD